MTVQTEPAPFTYGTPPAPEDAPPPPADPGRKPWRPALSPSRMNDFIRCPLLFRFRSIDRVPSPPSVAATRGTLVHSVLERLYDAPAGERTPDAARALLPREWDRLVQARPEVASLVASAAHPDGMPLDTWFGDAGKLLNTYFTLENPNYLEPAERELRVEHQLDGGPLLRGIVDRLDVSPQGWMRVVDYKTGRAPRPQYKAESTFQMRFYGLVLWRERGDLPKMLQLVYMGDGQVLRDEPTERQLEVTEDKIRALWEQIEAAAVSGVWEPRTGKLCGWCDHKAICPAFGGPTPEPPDAATVKERIGVSAAWEGSAHG